MSKIKNWSKVGDQAWENDKTGYVVSYGNLNGAIDGYKTTTPKSRRFDTKKEAERFLVKWMRQNPAPEKYESDIDYSKPKNMTRKERQRYHDKQQAAYDSDNRR